MPPRVVLVGPPGAGKSTVARLVGDKLGVPVRDTDMDVEAEAGLPIADLFVLHGEGEFRRYEAAAVARALDEHQGVLALGGGAVLEERTRTALRGHRVVFLDVSIKDAASRIGFNRDRPLLLGNPRAQWTRLMEQRRPLYEEVAATRVDTDGRTADEVAEQVVAFVNGETTA